MCGINGIVSHSLNSLADVKDALHKMNQLIVHRGPDDDGFFTDIAENKGIGMAMRRLAIIDLNSGQQPIISADRNKIIVFNGEIYNYIILRKLLEESGAVFTTNSDTEVILKLYEFKGVNGFKELDGMYAFSIYDKNEKKLFIARDYFGEKPLYYYKNSEKFVWASELKSILSTLNFKPEISTEGLNLFFKLTYIPSPFTIYKDIYKLEPNSYIDFDIPSNNLTIHKIHPEAEAKSEIIDFEAAKNKVKQLVLESIESRSIADVPLGTFLSGGVDSSIVSLGLSQLSQNKIDTFSIGFDKKEFDETDKSQTVAKLIKSNHHEFILSENHIKNSLEEILLNFDEPFADSSALPTYLVSKKTSEHVKVALTGDGGDEVFGGYNKYYIGNLNAKYTKAIPQGLHKALKKTSNRVLATKHDKRGLRFKLRKLLSAIDYSDEYYWNIISLGFIDTSVYFNKQYFLENAFAYHKGKLKSNPKTIHDFREIDRYLSLEGDMLVKVDRTSMLNSLECRAPFLNKKLWDYTNSLPPNFLMNKWNKKFILKEAFKDEFPKGFLDKTKQGFTVPVGDWLRNSLRSELEKYTKNDFLIKQGIFNPSEIAHLVQNHLNDKQDNSYKVWAYYTFQKWYNYTYL